MSVPSRLAQPDPDSDPFTPAARRLPTRVSNACSRCRRNKSRCDSFRPCSLCVRAGRDCEPAQVNHPPKARRRGFTPSQGPIPRRQTRRSGSRNAALHGVAISEAQRHSTTPTAHDGAEGMRTLSGDTPALEDDIGHTAHTDYGDSESAMGIARKICRLGSQSIENHPTSAIPDGERGTQTPRRRVGDQRLPIPSILGSRFPHQRLIHTLLENYFSSVHWFSLVIYEPKFRQRLSMIEDGHARPAEKPFLTLLSMVLCMASWYRSKTSSDIEADEMRLWSADLLRIVESSLADVMDQQSIAAAQTCILLGSHHVYHGRPNLSFALLGASVKMAQALGLHREPAKEDGDYNEEHKRVWWTIYTWDRFASISYGRPLSINDDDCDVSMPADFFESPYFAQQPTEQDAPAILYSAYQRELSKLYLIASPALKIIFGSLFALSPKQPLGRRYSSLVNDVTPKLMAWRNELPSHLRLDLNQDHCPSRSSWTNRAHTLQSLSLQLTFDNLLIVLYRPVLARRVEHLSLRTSNSQPVPPGPEWQGRSPSSSASNWTLHDQASPMSEATATSEYWWNAAVRTARVTELPKLAQLATDSHLVAFLAMNLFHAAIVLISIALSDPLSDRAQGVKRTITRVFRLQQLLGRRSALSSQSSDVLKELIGLLLRREEEAILAPVASATPKAELDAPHHPQPPTEDNLISVESTLRFPLEASLDISNSANTRQPRPSMSMAHRLNESLASVQRAFQTSQDHPVQLGAQVDLGHGQHFNGETMSLQANESWGMPSGQENDYEGTHAISNDEQVVNDGGNGLFWLWDDTWDGVGGAYVQ